LGSLLGGREGGKAIRPREATGGAQRLEFEMVGGQRPLPLRLEAGLYRIAQEALTNVARHANARHVTLRLVTTPDQVRLRVEDDGQGFDTKRLRPS
jgi:two-component system NarL family sensor kinase